MNILVTGGASGLGEAIVRKLAANTANKVYFTFAKSAGAAKKLTEELPNTEAIPCNFTEEASVSSMVEKIASMDLDVLVNNAYTGLNKTHFHKTPPEQFLESFNQNMMPMIRIAQQAISSFRNKKFGKIINIGSSVVVNKPPVGWADYTACKSYLISLSKSWATENIRFNITSNTISPAFMQTDLTSSTDERVIEEMISNHPLKKLLTTAEVAECVSFLTTCPQHINGVNIQMNAGEAIS